MKKDEVENPDKFKVKLDDKFGLYLLLFTALAPILIAIIMIVTDSQSSSWTGPGRFGVTQGVKSINGPGAIIIGVIVLIFWFYMNSGYKKVKQINN